MPCNVLHPPRQKSPKAPGLRRTWILAWGIAVLSTLIGLDQPAFPQSLADGSNPLSRQLLSAPKDARFEGGTLRIEPRVWLDTPPVSQSPRARVIAWITIHAESFSTSGSFMAVQAWLMLPDQDPLPCEELQPRDSQSPGLVEAVATFGGRLSAGARVAIAVDISDLATGAEVYLRSREIVVQENQ